MKKVNFISNLRINEISGGWSAMNHHVFKQLEQNYVVNVVDNISPQYDFLEKITSKILRTIGLRGRFPAFTNSRLVKIKDQVESKIDNYADINFFHGSTPWLYIKNKPPYFAYLDACFASYMNVYHDVSRYSKKQLEKLFQLDAQFLDNAQAVFFSSNWALEDAKTKYALQGNNFHYCGLGGGINFHQVDIDNKSNELFLLFISWDFLGKRGDKVVSAFNHVRERVNQSLKLKIVGQRPTQEFLNYPGIEYVGALNKTNPNDLEKLIWLFKNAYCFILPSSKDMTPLVLVEAASVGCPVISVDNFGIPEIVIHEKTGLLINSQSNNLLEDLVSSIERILQNKEERDTMGIQAKERIQEFFTWEKTGERIREVIEKSK